jgi:hypothetical protein
MTTSNKAIVTALENKMFKFTYEHTLADRLRLSVVALAGIVDGLVYLCTLTLVSSDIRPRIVFSDWYMEDET